MKKKIMSLIIGLCALTTTIPVSAKEINFPGLRVETGIYHDYLTIETTDGNVWLMDDDTSNPRYFDENGTAVFHEGESVIILFDMMATMETEDDIILDVHSLEY